MSILLRSEFASSLLNPEVSLRMVTSGRILCDDKFRIHERTIPEHLIYYIEGGTMAGVLDSRRVLLLPERLFWLQPGVPHAFSMAKDSPPGTVWYFRFFLGKKEPWRLQEDWSVFEYDPALKPVLMDLLPLRIPSGPLSDAMLRYRLGDLFCRLLSEGSEARDDSRIGLTAFQRRKVADFIQNHLTTRFSLEELANVVELNADYFSRQFKKSFNMPPQEWIKRERTRQAALLLLESTSSLTDIALSLGYEDIYFFSRQFKEVMGMSPRRYRTLKAGR